jgi:hypothetical protein
MSTNQVEYGTSNLSRKKASLPCSFLAQRAMKKRTGFISRLFRFWLSNSIHLTRPGTMNVRLAGSTNQCMAVVSEESMEWSFVFCCNVLTVLF